MTPILLSAAWHEARSVRFAPERGVVEKGRTRCRTTASGSPTATCTSWSRRTSGSATSIPAYSARGAGRARRDAARHARAGQESHRAPTRRRAPTRAQKLAAIVWKPEHATTSTPRAEAQGWDADVAAGGDGRRGPRRRGAVPEPRAVRARPRLRRACSGHRRPRARVRRGDRARLQRLAARFLRPRPDAHVRCGDGRAARRRRRRRRGASLRRGATASRRSFLQPGLHANRRPWHHRCVRPAVGRVRAARTCRSASTAAVRTYLRPDFSLEVFDKLMMWHTFNQPLGIMAVAREPHRRRRARALPEAARRAARRQLRVGAVAAAPPRRALRVARAATRRPTSTMKPSEYFRAQLLPLRRGRRGRPCKHYVDCVRRRQPRLLDRLSARATRSTRTPSTAFLKLPLSEDVASGRSSGTTGAGSTTCHSTTCPDMDRVLGIIGVGRMGGAMWQHLDELGHRGARARHERARDGGAGSSRVRARRPAGRDLAGVVDTVICSLPRSDDVDDRVARPEGRVRLSGRCRGR